MPKSRARTKKQPPRRTLRAFDEAAFQQHLKALDTLPEGAKDILEYLFASARNVLAARQDSFAHPASAEHRTLYEHAQGVLTAAAEEYHRQCARDTADGKSPTRDWLTRMRVISGGEWSKFADVDAAVEATKTA